MNLKIVNEYLTLAQKNKVPQILCYNDDDPNMLVCDITENNVITIKCLVCNYTIKPGYAMYDFMKNEVENNEREDSEELQTSS
jgi:hypothetical protein